MIKISNAKSIKEINELRDKGLYNAPFSVLEAMGKVDIEAGHGEIEAKIEEGELNSQMAIVEIYEAIDKAKQEIKDAQEIAIVEIYETLGGM